MINSLRRLDRVLLILLIPGLLSALYLGARRFQVESRNKSVELTLDYTELQNLSVSSGTPMPELLERFGAAGITGIAIGEDLLGDFSSRGQIWYVQQPSDVGPSTLIGVVDASLAERVFHALSARLAPGMINSAADGFTVQAAPQTLNLIGIGLPPDAVRLIKASNLDVVARLQNHPAITSRGIDAALRELREEGITRLICSGDEVIGFRGLIPHAVESLKDAGLWYGSIEFARQKGDARISRELDSQLIRVHSISYAEMAGMAPNTAAERFARAVKERNIRLCYVRLPATSGETAVDDGVAFVCSIRSQLGQAGYRTGMARPFEQVSRSPLLLALMALSVAAGFVLLIGTLFTLSSGWRYGLLAAGFAATAGMALTAEAGRQFLALATALIFPTLGVLSVSSLFGDKSVEKRPATGAVAGFFLMCAFTLMGAVLVAGLLTDVSYMLKVNQFMGIKAAHLVPILGVITVMAAGLPIFDKPFGQVQADVASNIRKVVGHPLFVWHALAVVAAMVIIGLALLRTGNDPGVGVSGIELKLRSILDRLMVVRPRTKEFLIGHPAMFVGLAMLLQGRKSWGLPLVVLGVIGQVSVLNTFCHIHTPLMITVIRAANGLILGLALGLAVWFVIRFFERRSAGKRPS